MHRRSKLDIFGGADGWRTGTRRLRRITDFRRGEGPEFGHLASQFAG
jgi:hypothetical protein